VEFSSQDRSWQLPQVQLEERGDSMDIGVWFIHKRNVAFAIEPVTQALDDYVRATQPEDALLFDCLLILEVLQRAENH
jgi:hypothetical protein